MWTYHLFAPNGSTFVTQDAICAWILIHSGWRYYKIKEITNA